MWKFKPFQKVIINLGPDDFWRADFYSHYDYKQKSHVCTGRYVGLGFILPYEGNENLLGTTDMPEPKHEYQWGDKVEVRPKDIWIKALYNEPAKDNPHKHRVYGYHEFYGHLSAFLIHEDHIRPLKQ